MKVAIGIIFNEQQQVFLTKRSMQVSHGGFWEFPGGKLEAQETPAQALIRELREETGIEVEEYTFLNESTHSYSDKTVTLFTFIVKKFTNTPKTCEQQLDFRWVAREELKKYNFPEANNKIIAWLQSPTMEIG